MSRITRILSALTLFILLMFTFAAPVSAFDGRSGDRIVIAADQVITDDLYVSAREFVLDGTIIGDLFVAGQTITINGTVQGDLMAAGQTVIINGTVTDDARIAGAALQVGNEASIGSDLIALGASLETKEGSDVKGELVVGSGQALLAGEVAGDVLAGTGGLDLRGSFGKDVQAYVGEADQNAPPMNMYITNSPITIPPVRPGLTIDKDAQIAGNLEYTSSKDMPIPSHVVSGLVTRVQPRVPAQKAAPTPAQKAMEWSFNLLRSIVTLVLFGILLGWLAPRFIQSLAANLKSKPVPSLGWGVIAYAAFFFVLLVIIVVMILAGLVFGALTLNSVSGTIIWSSLMVIFALILGFVLVTAFLTKITVGAYLGTLIFGRLNPAQAGGKFWPIIVGVVIVALLVALPLIGWLFGLLIMFLGLGALWLWGRERLVKKTA
jgi:cytoskeletal protein CcmA (bactofilin family)